MILLKLVGRIAVIILIVFELFAALGEFCIDVNLCIFFAEKVLLLVSQ
jgi:hypothetical protein